MTKVQDICSSVLKRTALKRGYREPRPASTHIGVDFTHERSTSTHIGVDFSHERSTSTHIGVDFERHKGGL